MTIDNLKTGGYYYFEQGDSISWVIRFLKWRGATIIIDGGISIKQKLAFLKCETTWGDKNLVTSVREATSSEIDHLEACRSACKYVLPSKELFYEIY